MIQTIKQNKKAVLAFLLALVMLIGIIPFTATEVQAVTIPVGDITTNNSFGNGDTWETGDELYFCRVSKDNQWAEYTLTANVEDEVTTWTPSEKLYWDDKGEHQLVVNYPADTGWVWDTWYILEDQSTLEKLKAADHMNAMWKGNPTTDPINLNLKHRLSMVTVTYTFASEFADEPDITPEVYSNTQYMLFDINTLERRNVEWQEDHAIWVTPYQHDGANGEKQFTAIVSPDAYSAGDEFIRITIGDQVLTAKMKEDITFEEGTHYTFDLKVGKDKVTLTLTTTDTDFPGGWNNEVTLDGGSATDTQDEGKTAWVDGDQIIATLASQYYGEQTAMLTFSGSDGTWSTDESFSYLEDETPTVSAIYAPCYEVVDGNMQLKDGLQLGMTEYILAACSVTDGILNISFDGAIRNYSRLRIFALPGQTLTVTTTDFTPAGATKAATEAYTLTADENGNVYLYGTFAEGATINVKQGEVTLADYTFTADKNPNGTEHNKSYALYAGKKVNVDLSTLTATYVINDDAYYTFTGTGCYGIKVESGNPRIILNNTSITVGEGSAIDVASGSNATILVLGDNTIGTTKTEYSDVPCGGIFVAEGGTVNITSNGTDNILRAHGTLAAAIGGKYVYADESYNAGSISISNVTVYAYTNNNYAAAIGAAGRGSCGTINITNAVVYAYGAGDRWTSAPGIGSAWDHVGWAETIPVVIISDSEVHTFRHNSGSDYIGYLGDVEFPTNATGSINCGEGGSVKSSIIYCYTGLDATTTDKVVTYDADGNPTEN